MSGGDWMPLSDWLEQLMKDQHTGHITLNRKQSLCVIEQIKVLEENQSVMFVGGHTIDRGQVEELLWEEEEKP